VKYTVVKTSYGFEYCLGQFVIARGVWAKRGGVWKINLRHLVPTPTQCGIAVCDTQATLEVAEVFPYLNNLIYGPPAPTKEDMT
jgi:hypothetical protein